MNFFIFKSGFLINLLGKATSRNNDPDLYRDLFLDCNKSEWEKGSQGGLLRYKEDNAEYELAIIHSYKYGFAFFYTKSDKGSTHVFNSVISFEKFDEFIICKSGQASEEGTFLPNAEAWCVFSDFLKNPKNLESNDYIYSSQEIENRIGPRKEFEY